MILRDKYGYPVETIFGKPVTNLIRRILHTNIRRTLAGEPLNEDEIAIKIKPTQSNVALAHSAFAGKTIYGDAAFPSVTIASGAPPGVGPGYCEDSPFSVNRAALADAAATQEQPAGSGAASRIKALPSIKDEHGDECVSRAVVLALLEKQ